MSPASFTFLHAADLHLGSPLGGLALKDPEIARRFAHASREAFSSLVDQALAAKVAFVIIAGDVYDGAWKDAAIGLFFNREIARLAKAQIPVYLLKGNHDAESEVSRALPAPPGVHTFSTRVTESFQIETLGVALHGRSYPVRDVSENYALNYPPPVPGLLNIGVLHTALTGRAGHANYAPCDPADLISRGYGYWALGHVHDYEEVCAGDPTWIVYPGNIQGRSVRECGPKGAVLVDVSHGQITAVRRIYTDCARWALAEADISAVTSEEEFSRQAQTALNAAARDGAGLTALRLRITGRSAFHHHVFTHRHRLREEIQALADHVAQDLWIEKLEIASAEPAAAHDAALAGLDLAAAMQSLEADPELQAEALRLLKEIGGKLPQSFDLAALDDPASLIADARAIVLGRSAGST